MWCIRFFRCVYCSRKVDTGSMTVTRHAALVVSNVLVIPHVLTWSKKDYFTTIIMCFLLMADWCQLIVNWISNFLPLCFIIADDCRNLPGAWAVWLASCDWYLQTASWMWVKSTSAEALWRVGQTSRQHHHKFGVETDETHICWGRTCCHCLWAKIYRMEV